MNILGHAGFSRFRKGEWSPVSLLLPLALLFASWPQTLWARQDAQSPASPDEQTQPARAAYTQQTPEQLQQLVAPIALYRRSWQRLHFPSKSLRQIDGCKRILI
jgi:hypothetical protein